MTDDNAEPRFPSHRLVIDNDNIEHARSIMPDDQRSLVRAGCQIWRMPPEVDKWVEPMGVTLSFWPDTQRGALHLDGSLDGSSWGMWHAGELWLDDGIAVDVHGRTLRIVLGEKPPQSR